jgi:hypothetical protein
MPLRLFFRSGVGLDPGSLAREQSGHLGRSLGATLAFPGPAWRIRRSPLFAVLDTRPALYAADGYGSLFSYCTQGLRLSEDAACNRIEAARACRRFPQILDRLAAGSLTLTTVRLLGRHLTVENHEVILTRAANRSRREIDELIAELAPRPDVPVLVRRIPSPPTTHVTAPALATEPEARAVGAPAPASAPVAGASIDQPARPIPRPVVAALSPERYRVQFTIGADTEEKLRRLQALLRREIPAPSSTVRSACSWRRSRRPSSARSPGRRRRPSWSSTINGRMRAGARPRSTTSPFVADATTNTKLSSSSGVTVRRSLPRSHGDAPVAVDGDSHLVRELSPFVGQGDGAIDRDQLQAVGLQVRGCKADPFDACAARARRQKHLLPARAVLKAPYVWSKRGFRLAHQSEPTLFAPQVPLMPPMPVGRDQGDLDTRPVVTSVLRTAPNHGYGPSVGSAPNSRCRSGLRAARANNCRTSGSSAVVWRRFSNSDRRSRRSMIHDPSATAREILRRSQGLEPSVPRPPSYRFLAGNGEMSHGDCSTAHLSVLGRIRLSPVPDRGPPPVSRHVHVTRARARARSYPLFNTRTTAGRCTPGCDPRTPGRCGPPRARTCALPARARGTRPARACRGGPTRWR